MEEKISELQEIVKGLKSTPKRIDSRYFYDKRGDKIFQQIMAMPTYYLTRCEIEILTHHSKDILDAMDIGTDTVEIVELGAGDGSKTSIFLSELIRTKKEFVYKPVDVSENVLREITERMKLANVPTQPLQTTYTGAIEKMASGAANPRLVMFLGSNIGNMELDEARSFVRDLCEVMQKGDHLLIGLDMKKDPEIIKAAYDDPEGITSSFNLNMLLHLNREFGANFPVADFKHQADYDEKTGAARSFLICEKPFDLSFFGINERIHIQSKERISTEISQKYDDGLVAEVFGGCSFEQKGYWQDEKRHFRDYLFIKK